MNSTEKVVKHLEMIQRYIIRYGFYSLLTKGGSLLLVITSQVLLATLVFVGFLDNNSTRDEISLVYPVGIVIIIIVLGFWLLDAYFLQGERLFRHHYDTVRQQSDTDLNMYVSIYKNRPKGNYVSAFFSVTLMLFYTIELIFALFIPVVILFSDIWH